MHRLAKRIADLRPALTLAYLSVMGCLCVLSVQAYMGLRFDPSICALSMALIFGIYTYNRFTDMEEDFTNDIARVLFFQGKRAFLALAILAMAGSFAFLLARGKLNSLHIALLGIGICYSYRMIPWYSRGQGLRLVRIKELTLVKNLAVSFLWGACVFAIPMLNAPEASHAGFTHLLLGAGLFLSTLNNTLFDDILDEPGDRVAGIRTLPTVWGARNSYRLLWGLDLLWLGSTAALYAGGYIDIGHAAVLAALALYPFVYMRMHLSGRVPKWGVDFLAESDLLVFAVGLLLLAR